MGSGRPFVLPVTASLPQRQPRPFLTGKSGLPVGTSDDPHDTQAGPCTPQYLMQSFVRPSENSICFTILYVSFSSHRPTCAPGDRRTGNCARHVALFAADVARNTSNRTIIMKWSTQVLEQPALITYRFEMLYFLYLTH